MLRVEINVSFKMVPHFPKLSGHSPSYSEPTDLLADFSLILVFLDFDALPTPRQRKLMVRQHRCLPTMYVKRTVA